MEGCPSASLTGWFSDSLVPLFRYPTLVLSGFLSFFGSLNVAVPFLLDQFRIPADTFQLFLATGVVNQRFGTLVAAVHTIATMAAAGRACCRVVRPPGGILQAMAQDSSGTPRLGHWFPKSWPRVALLVIVFLSALLGLAHTSPVRKAVLARVTGLVRAKYGVELAATGLRYNLLTLRAELTDVSVAASNTPVDPFARADLVAVDFGAGTLLGSPEVRRVTLTSPRFELHRNADGTSNLPSVQGSQAGGPNPALPELSARGLDLSLIFPSVHIEIRGVSVAVTRTANDAGVDARIDATQGLVIETQQGPVQMNAATADLSFDGRAITLRRLIAAKPGTKLSGNGTVSIAGNDAPIDVEVSGSSDVAPWAQWIGATVTGTVDLAAHLSGTLSNPSASIQATASDLRWSSIVASHTQGRASWQDNALTINELTVVSNAGRVDLDGRIVPGGPGDSRVTARWSGIHVQRLLGAVGVSFDAKRLATDGSMTWRWNGEGQAAGTAAASARLGTRSIGVGVDIVQRDRLWNLTLKPREGDPVNFGGNAEVVTNAGAWSSYSVRGAVSVQLPQISEIDEPLREFGVLTESTPVDHIGGSAELDASIAGTLGAIRARGQLRVTSLAVSGAPAVDAESRFAVDFLRAISTGTFEGRVTDLGTHAGPAMGGLDLHGELHLSGSWSGPLTSPVALVALSGRDLRIDDMPIASLSLEGRASPALIEVTRAVLRQSDGAALDLKGRYEPATGTMALTANGAGLMIEPPLASSAERPILSDVSIVASVDGPVEALQGTATIRAGAVRVGSAGFGAFTLDLSLTNNFVDVKLTGSGPGASMNARVGLTSPRPFNGTAQVTTTDFAQLLASVGTDTHLKAAVPVAASLTFEGELDRIADATADLTVAPLAGTVGGVEIQTSDPAKVSVKDRRVALQPLRLAAGGVSLRTEGALGIDDELGQLSVDVDGDLEGLSPWLQTVNAKVEPLMLAGHVNGRLDARRSSAGLSLTGSLASTAADLHRGAQSLATSESVRMEFTGSRAAIEARATVKGVELIATGALPLAWANEWLPNGWQFDEVTQSSPAILDLRVSSSTASMMAIADIPVEEDVGGGIAGTIHLTADRPSVDAVTGEIRFDRASLTTAGGAIEQSQPTVLRLTGGNLAIDVLQWQGPGNRFTIDGLIGLRDRSATHANIDVDGDLRLFDAVLPGRITGRLAAKGILAGGGTALNLTADAHLSDGTWLLPGAGILLSDWAGRFHIDAKAVEFIDVAGRVNGGAVRLSGRLPLLKTETGSISVVAEDILLNIPTGLHSQISGKLAWSPDDGGASSMRGALTVTASPYTEPITRVLELTDALSTTTSAASEDSLLPGILASTRLDVDIQVTDPVVIDNSIGSIELLPALRLVGTLGTPTLTGRVSAEPDGRIRVGGRTYRLRESSLLFSPASGLMPTLDATGETTIGDYAVTVRMTGAANQIETSYSSSPPLSQRELRSLVVTGRTNADTGQDGDDNFALAAASDDVLGFAGKFIGLDSVRLGTADLDIAARQRSTAQHVTVSKSFGRTFEVTVSDNLENGAFTWLVAWSPFVGYQLRAASIEGTEYFVEFRQELSFGPGRPRATTSPRIQSTAPIVAEVVFTGSPGFERSDLKRVLRLTEGRRFDARQWTADRLKLENLYTRRGYRRVRIAPSRREEAADGQPQITLEYEIDRGPLTFIKIAGSSLTDESIDAMYEAWRGIPIVEIAGTEFERLARVDLINRGYLKPKIEIEFVSDTADLARAIIHVDQGAQMTRRVIAWSGNNVIATADLDAIERAQTAETSIWVDPAAVSGRIAASYKRLGYYDARITVGNPTIEGSVATLPVAIAEGQPTLVGDLTVDGVSATDNAEVLRVLDLPGGAAFRSTSALDAKRRLEVFYRELGYRDVSVDVTSTRSNQMAAVHVKVNEGGQQIVDRVRVLGVDSTARSLVSSAVTLAPGQLATPSAADTTRQNLYGIGTFRRVEVSFTPDSERSAGTQKVPVLATILAEEPKRYQFRYGVEVSQDASLSTGLSGRNLGGTAEFWDRNFLGRALQASTTFRIDRAVRAATLLFSAPRLAGYPIRTTLYTQARREVSDLGNDVEFQNHLREVTLEQRWRARPTIEFTWSYGFSARRLLLSSPEQRLEFAGPLAGPGLSITIDHRDSFDNPTSGWYHSSNLQMGLEPLGSQLGYYRYFFKQTQLVPLGPITLAGSVRWGLLRGFSGTAPISALDLFFTAGGTNSVRGYPQGFLSAVSLGPELRLGGTDLLLLNGEIRYPIIGWLGGAAFIDSGNTFVREIDLKRLGTGAGIGLRLKTPVVLLRLDLAYPLSPMFDTSSPRFHFSVGQMF